MKSVEILRRSIRGLNDEHGRGGKTRLAKLLGWNYATLWRKLNGKSAITKADEIAAEAVAEIHKKSGAV